MKFLKSVVLGLAAVLTACSNGGGSSSTGSSQVVAPNDFTIEQPSGTPLTQVQMSQLRSLIGAHLSVHPDLLFAKTDSKERARQASLLRRLNSEQKQKLNWLRSSCSITSSPAGDARFASLTAGQVAQQTQSKSVSGANCPLQYSENSQLTFTLTQFSGSDYSMQVQGTTSEAKSVSDSFVGNGNIKAQQSQQATRGVITRTGMKTSNYMQASSNGSITLKNGTVIQTRMVAESFTEFYSNGSSNESEKTKSVVMFEFLQGQRRVQAYIRTATNGQKEYFLNGQRISTQTFEWIFGAQD